MGRFKTHEERQRKIMAKKDQARKLKELSRRLKIVAKEPTQLPQEKEEAKNDTQN